MLTAHKGNIANFKIPRYVRFVESFPMSAGDKAQKFKLRESLEKTIISVEQQ